MSVEDRTTTHEELIQERLLRASRSLEDAAARIKTSGPDGSDLERVQDVIATIAAANLNALQHVGEALARVEVARPAPHLAAEEWARVLVVLRDAHLYSPETFAACSKLREQIVEAGQ